MPSGGLQYMMSKAFVLALCAVPLLQLAPSSARAGVPMAPPSMCIDSSCTSPPESVTGGMKWHPGHYVLLDGQLRRDNRSTLMTQHMSNIKELANEPTIKGVKIFVQWSALEGDTPGDYTAGINMLREYVKSLKAINKRLMISINDRQFGGYGDDLTIFFPKYIVNDSKYGVTKMRNGITTRIWQQATMDRLIAANRALAAVFDKESHFELVTSGETSVAVTAGTDGFSNDALTAQLKRLATQGRALWPHTAFRISTNYLGNDSMMNGLISHMAQNNLTIGGPDVIPTETIQANAVVNGLRGALDLRGRIAIAAEVQSPSLGGHEGTWTPRQLYDFAMNELRPQYFVWYRNTWSGGAAQKWSTGILPFIRSINGAVYSTSCPTNYKSCTT
jgi:hypothetical protein